MPQVAETSFEDLTGRIYAASLDQSRWIDVLTAVHRIFPATCPELLRHDRARGILTAPLALGYDPADVARHNAYYGAINPWPKGFLNRPLGTAITPDEMFPYEDLIRTEFWADFIGPATG
jgi:hypothetical protein